MNRKTPAYNALCFYADRNKINVEYFSAARFYKYQVPRVTNSERLSSRAVDGLDRVQCDCLYKSLATGNEKFNYYLSAQRI